MKRYPRGLALSLFGTWAIAAAPACQKSAGPAATPPPAAAVDAPTSPTPATDAAAPANDTAPASAPDANPAAASDANPASASDTNPAAAPSGAPTVTLLAPGAEPRATLRYALAPDLAEATTLALATSLELRVAGQVMPNALPRTRLEVSAKSGAPSGEGTPITITLDGADLAEGEPAAETPAGTRLTEVIRGMKGLHGDKIVAARGVTRAFHWTLPDDAPAALRPVFESFQTAIDQMTVPWPSEAVGVGASWETVQRVTQSGLTLDQKTSFEVKRVDGDVVELDFTATLSGPPGKLSGPLTGGLTADVKKLEGSGKGHLVVSLKKLLPDTLTAENQIALTLSVEQADGKSRELEVTMKLSLASAPK